MSEKEAPDPEQVGTTNEDYRWKGLSTLWCLIYGLGFPFWIALSNFYGWGLPTWEVMAPLSLAWGGTVVYIIGPENIESWKKLRGGGEDG